MHSTIYMAVMIKSVEDKIVRKLATVVREITAQANRLRIYEWKEGLQFRMHRSGVCVDCRKKRKLQYYEDFYPCRKICDYFP